MQTTLNYIIEEHRALEKHSFTFTFNVSRFCLQLCLLNGHSVKQYSFFPQIYSALVAKCEPIPIRIPEAGNVHNYIILET